MKILGLTIPWTKAAVTSVDSGLASLSTVSSWRSLWNVIREPFTGAWQRNVSWTPTDALTSSPVFACVTTISSDIGKLRIMLTEETSPGIWDEVENPAYSPVLRKPNHYQIRIEFVEQWITSKLLWGNAYILKERDVRGVVSSLYVLDASRVTPQVTPAGDVYYALADDPLSGLDAAVVVPAREIIHDKYFTPYHPLCGVSPLSASGLAAQQGLNIQHNSATFFARGSQPSGILAYPSALDDEEHKKYEEKWQANFAKNAGAVAVLGGDWKYTPMSMPAHDAQLIEQLKWTAEDICRAFKVPPYKVNVGPAPSYNNVEALDQQYYAQCLQVLIEKVEAHLDEGLGLSNTLGTELDLDGLMRMDTPSRVTAAKDAVNGGGMTFNEARRQFYGLGPTPGGDVVLSQQQNFSLEALARRDAQPNPFAPAAAPDRLPEPVDELEREAALALIRTKSAERFGREDVAA